MEVISKLRYLRIAPRKVRLVADLIRGKTADEAQTILNFTTKKAAKPLLKLLKSAIANAKHNFQMDEGNLYISKITVDEGPKYKRWRARARGQAAEIQKKTSHITLVLDEIEKKYRRETKKVRETQEELSEEKELSKEEKLIKKPKMRFEAIKQKPKIDKGLKKIFRRKAF
ncbi:50S ribosomal protein L22 [bacterium]|nr:50S ribosomal protein L22 [bacterium]